ncbi:serine/threonine protein kinase [Dulcicalothrix desertica PCC 7102]|uniref:Serine/threonine protein kinase n=1 Tax=Dulcicalothrix desertica PCC 7102 TaxID=232991 RepID=A0A3S1AM87_9CYAN|nr:diguanylate cyclase [Dulcicalothrix desertica]RUT04439.1 serine/threonine protein kinase [Dulcicalothrix desertica PCC 7102]TWH51289.1 diguanylate cyclase (GGDEF)-like protein [Dulcicalothrix desertica PCC 7102]
MVAILKDKIFEKIYEGIETAVYRSNLKQGQKPVVIKLLKSEYPALEEVTRLRHEYKVLKDLSIEGVIKPYGLEKYQNGFALILEDFVGQPLSQILKERQLTISKSLITAIALASILIDIEKAGIIHKDIKPSNIIINVETGQVKLTNFGFSSRLHLEKSTISNPNLLEGTLAYMAPEQTGRMNRSIDYRTDFYSLGVTLYEMLTGTLPFTSNDPMELVHCHIAKQPVPPYLKKQIPQPVSDIVMKLLAKNAEERYQSATGLKFDLETCLLQLESTGEIKDFILGQRDHGSQLLIPQKLYGREQEVAMLMNAFRRVSQGATEIMLVTGYSGIGKTSIVNEVHKSIVAARGYFITGKFDQFRRDIPYAALIQAFQELIRQLLTENEQQIAVWKNKLLEAFGDNGQVLIDVIPEVELIIGFQTDVPKLGTTESENRFNRVFQQFVNVFCQPEHPLIIFLDDLQWADSASLKLIRLLIADKSSKYLFFIGAYRDNEVNPTSPLIQTLEKLHQTDIVIHNISVESLLFTHVQQLVADTLNEAITEARVKLLAELVFNKTQGNPFFVTQLLKSLYSERLLVYQVATDKWQWEIQQIQAVGITDYNIVELIARNIRKLPLDTQKVLQLAACIGNQFNLDILATVNETSEILTAAQLWSALQAGLILPLSSNYKIPMVFESTSDIFKVSDAKIEYKFLHDRVQQATYSLIPESSRKNTHLKIGQLLLKHTTAQEQKDNIFTLVNQLNFGTDLLKTQIEKDELAQLNLIAGQKAKAATAYEAAVNYLNIGLKILHSDSWQNQYRLTLNFYIEISDAEYLNANLTRALTLCELALQQVHNLLDNVKLYQIKIKIYLAQNQIDTVLDIGQNVLQMLGISLVESAPQNFDVEQLASRLPMTDPCNLAAMEILILIWAPACFGKSQIALPILYTMVELSMQYGNSPPSIYAYAIYGVITSWLLLDINLAYQLGQTSLKILDKLNAKELKSKALVTIYMAIIYKKEHIKETINPLHEAIDSGLEVGDIEFACHAANFYCSHLFFVGKHLELVAENQGIYIEFISKLEQQHPLYLTKICAQSVANLLDKSASKTKLIGEILNEKEALPYFFSTNNLMLLFNVYFYKSFLCYFFEEYHSSVNYVKTALNYAGFIQGEVIFTLHNWFYSLALIAEYSDNLLKSENKQVNNLEEYLSQVDENQKKMKYWAEHAPMNYQHKYDLVEAEKARVLGQTLAAMDYYDRAITGSRENGFIQEEALAYELAAKFYLALGQQEIARAYMTKAHYGYICWGAIAKAKDLESKYSHIIIFSKLDKNTINSQVLDLTTIIKASQAIASEIILEQLLKKIMIIVIENAGAQTGFLVLKQQEKLFIQAKSNIDTSEVVVCQSVLKETSEQLPNSLINYVVLTRENVILKDASHEGLFTTDKYIIQNQPLSVLCTPIINQGELLGVLYLENNLAVGAFTSERLEVLKVLSSQAAISIKNAQLYQNCQLEICERQQAEEALRESEKKLAQFLEALPIGIFTINSQGQPCYANQTAQKILGKGIVPGTNSQLSEIYQAYTQGTQKYYPDDESPIFKALNGESSTINDVELHFADKITPLEVTATPIFDSQGNIIYAIAAFQDITQRKQAEVELASKNMALQEATEELAKYNRNLEEKVQERTKELSQTLEILKATQSELIKANQELHRLSRIDKLTQVANRFCFDEYLLQEWNRLEFEQQPLSLIICDVDYFKKYNDFYGHQSGDHCLQLVVKALLSVVNSPTHLLARYGGEEFAVIMPSTGVEEAIIIAEAIQQAIHQAKLPHACSDISQYVTISLGIATVIPNNSISQASLIATADKALYEAKRQGRDCYVHAL